jgi:two-component system response regulator HydG
MPSNSILIVDDDPDVLDALKVLLEDDFAVVATETNTNRFQSLDIAMYDLVLLDMNFSAGINTGNEGLYWLSRIREGNPSASVIMMTAYGKIDLAVEAIKRGAKDFILKPWDNDKLLATLKAALGSRKNTAVQASPESGTQYLQAVSANMRALEEKMHKVAATDASVLLLGENGTGKEVIAREIHQHSLRARAPFVAVDMATLSPTLFESELFGHVKGSFTDAHSDRKGRFESAVGGTLFLDEIGNLPLALQAKLLTVLQTQSFVPVGSNKETKLNARIITATNADVMKMVDEGTFRRDLLYRINTITLTVPPLRERREDIQPLSEFFLRVFNLRYGKTLTFEPAAAKAMQSYPWPGNVRELQHTIEKTVILSSGEKISAIDLNLSLSSKDASAAMGSRTLDDLEREALKSALAEYQGNIVQAAKALGITRQTLYNKLKKYGL